MANLSWISSNPDYINQMIRNTQVTLSNNYNDLDNIPIIKITSTTNNPQKIWELKEGLYIINGVAQVDNNTSYEVSNLLISMTARLENGKYILSAFIPYLRGLFEYILKTNSIEYEQHQKIVLMIKDDTLTLDNETIYTPIENYHPATKKYVDDKANEIVAELDRMGVNKENLESLNKENRIRDIKLQALLSETSDRNITIEENVRYFDMPLSIDNGIVTINEIVGETLVNVCDQEESVAITKSYTVENENHIALQGEYDGSCRPVVYGNTLVNHNTDWDGKVQTGVETSASGIEDVEVEGLKGQEVSVVVEGNTVLNHALGKTSAVVSSVEDNLWDFNYIETNFGGGTVNYSSDRIFFKQTKDYMYTNIFLDRKDIIKPNAYYTLIVDMFKNTLSTEDGIILNSYSSDSYTASDVFTIYGETNDGREGSQNKISGGNIGRFIYKLKSKSDFSVSQYALRTFIENTTQGGELEFSIKLLEGDHTTNPKYVNSNEGNYVDLTVANDISSVVEIEGRTMYYNNDTGEYLYEFVENSNLSLKSSYECEVTEDGKYKVDVKVTGKNLFDKSNVITSDYNNVENMKYPDNSVIIHRDEWWSGLLEVTDTGVKWETTDNSTYKGIVVVCHLKPNATYTLSFNALTEINVYGKGYKTRTFTTDGNGYYKTTLECNNLGYGEITNIQVEEGTVATSYEPYFESTKTFYLNSPLLEGDKIVTKNGKVYHYHKMGMVVLDGSENWILNVNDTNTIWFYSDKITESNLLGSVFCNTLHSALEIQNDNETILQSEDRRIHIRINKSKLATQDAAGLVRWLQANPTTVVYELASPHYELIDEYNNTILNIPKNVAHLTHTSTVPVNNTVFTNYKDELNVLEANTQYRVMFDCDTANIPFTVTLGGTSQEVTSKIGTHSLLITTPSELVDKNLVIDGIGRCGIDNIRIFKGDVEYDYVKGLWSGYEERKLENLLNDDMYTIYGDLSPSVEVNNDNEIKATSNSNCIMVFGRKLINIKPYRIYTVICDVQTTLDIAIGFGTIRNVITSEGFRTFYNMDTNYNHIVCKLKCKNDNVDKISIGQHSYISDGEVLNIKNLLVLEGDWTDNPPTYEEVMANEGKYAVKVKLDTNATIFGKGGRL